jgi:hypothetical protein
MSRIMDSRRPRNSEADIEADVGTGGEPAPAATPVDRVEIPEAAVESRLRLCKQKAIKLA